ncbi:uncharacterized protein LOC108112039 isoform X3 [Drosophila eugracilis]|uniref:uncharacterized protein LOC108112039 isoform X3 n=1 Tax=Drosophila eugracilis TaxID=29029 RepID=UPI001BDB2431|nr:uncharacterized protein LOC108112039 isoform X3 [Drosophila eugracilis]
MLSSVCCIRLNTYGVVISYLSLIVSTLATGVLFLFSANVTYSILTDVLYFILCACCFLVLVNIVTFTTMAVGIVQFRFLEKASVHASVADELRAAPGGLDYRQRAIMD